MSAHSIESPAERAATPSTKLSAPPATVNAEAVPSEEDHPQQAQLPFAMVLGKPFTELPKDLYIPPEALEVFLEAFEGPLDLLLYLIRRQNLDILSINVAEITRQYLAYIEMMQVVQLELAAEYLLMAAMLAEIKSRMLLPRQPEDDTEEDPRAELIRRLQEYERFKRAADTIDSLPRVGRDLHIASANPPPRSDNRPVPTVDLRELLLVFAAVLRRSELNESHHIAFETLSTRARMSDILERLRDGQFTPFVSLFQITEGRMGVVVTFLAVMELIRESLLELVQAEPFGPLHVKARTR